MADESQLEIRKRGVTALNEWRRKKRDHIVVDLSEANLAGAILSANFGGAILGWANLRIVSLAVV